MRLRTLSVAALILLTPLVALAFQAHADQVHKRDLKGKPFTAGPLKITLTNINYGGGLGNNIGYINIEVENTSDDFTTFDPRLLWFIDKGDNQVDIFGLGRSVGGKFVVVAEGGRKIGPKAKIQRDYALTNKVQLPTRLYYEEKLLATITE